MKRAFLTVGLISLALLVAGCGAPSPEPAGASSTDAQDASGAAGVQRIGVIEARLLLEDEQAVLCDTRSASSFLREHIAGAVSFPEAEAASRAGELPRDKAIIFY
jgi:hypothetical protein